MRLTSEPRSAKSSVWKLPALSFARDKAELCAAFLLLTNLTCLPFCVVDEILLESSLRVLFVFWSCPSFSLTASPDIVISSIQCIPTFFPQILFKHCGSSVSSRFRFLPITIDGLSILKSSCSLRFVFFGAIIFCIFLRMSSSALFSYHSISQLALCTFWNFSFTNSVLQWKFWGPILQISHVSGRGLYFSCTSEVCRTSISQDYADCLHAVSAQSASISSWVNHIHVI